LTRILPLYYIALLTTIFVEGLIATARPACWPNGLNLPVLLGQVVVVQNLTETFGSFAPSWSITNELFYYLFFGGLAAFLPGKRRPVWAGLAACLVIGFSLQLLYVAGFRLPLIRGTGLLFGLGTNWFVGALVAIYRNELAQNRWTAALSRTWPIWLISAMAMLFSQRVRMEAVFMTAGAAFALLLVRFLAIDAAGATSRTPRLTRGLRRISGGLGLSSYPTYLFHGPILMLLGSLILRVAPGASWWSIWASTTVVAILAGIALGYLAEQPLMRWRAGLLARLRTSSPGSAASAPLAIPSHAGRQLSGAR
jgi:peptidoglycan/LPS O-acetylase OafA/YrhL